MQVKRLSTAQHFNQVAKNGKKTVCKNFIAIICHNICKTTDLPEGALYLGMKVSKKFAKNATERNKAKRRIRAAVRQIAGILDSSSNRTGIVVIPRITFNEANFENITHNLYQVINRQTMLFDSSYQRNQRIMLQKKIQRTYSKSVRYSKFSWHSI